MNVFKIEFCISKQKYIYICFKDRVIYGWTRLYLSRIRISLQLGKIIFINALKVRFCIVKQNHIYKYFEDKILYLWII